MGSRTRMENYCSAEAPIYASSDIHSPMYLSLFKESLRGIGSACVFILAGDIVDGGVVAAAEPVIKAVKEKIDAVIIAVYGNEEYVELEEEFKRRYPEVTWLNDEYIILEYGDESVAVVGTRGALGRLTRWQQKHAPHLEKVYRERPSVLRGLIREARREADKVILVSHYALTRHTIRGEPERIWLELYSPDMERVVLEEKPDAAIHGHSHNGRPFELVRGVRVYNVALPLNRRIVPVYLKGGTRPLTEWLTKGRGTGTD